MFAGGTGGFIFYVRARRLKILNDAIARISTLSRSFTMGIDHKKHKRNLRVLIGYTNSRIVQVIIGLLSVPSYTILIVPPVSLLLSGNLPNRQTHL